MSRHGSLDHDAGTSGLAPASDIRVPMSGSAPIWPDLIRTQRTQERTYLDIELVYCAPGPIIPTWPPAWRTTPPCCERLGAPLMRNPPVFDLGDLLISRGGSRTGEAGVDGGHEILLNELGKTQ